MRNPTFVVGGFSPNVLVMVTVRDELFPAADEAAPPGTPARPLPKKGHNCTLETLTETLELQVGEIASGSGEVIHKLTLWDRNQNA